MRALLPVPLDQLITAIPALVDHFDGTDSRLGKRQHDRFLAARAERIDLQAAA